MRVIFMTKFWRNMDKNGMHGEATRRNVKDDRYDVVLDDGTKVKNCYAEELIPEDD